jgi:hypothetical protein
MVCMTLKMNPTAAVPSLLALPGLAAPFLQGLVYKKDGGPNLWANNAPSV